MGQQIYGLDFTSAPSNSKPLTLAVCEFEGATLHLREFTSLVGTKRNPFEPFVKWLETPGPWMAGIDFPFGQPIGLIDELQWPPTWPEYVAQVQTLGRKNFETALKEYKRVKPDGKKELCRTTDEKAQARSPMKLANPPVGKMFFEGATRLLESKASIKPVRPVAGETRIVVEAYPALVARKWIGKKQGYKNDDKKKWDDDMRYARCDIVHAIRGKAKNECRKSVQDRYGLTIEMTDAAAEVCVKDDTGDLLDSVLCAVQAAWAWCQRTNNYGIPQAVNSLEGWIVDPGLL